jgi:hypothetical protein
MRKSLSRDREGVFTQGANSENVLHVDDLGC